MTLFDTRRPCRFCSQPMLSHMIDGSGRAVIVPCELWAADLLNRSSYIRCCRSPFIDHVDFTLPAVRVSDCDPLARLEYQVAFPVWKGCP